MSSPNRAQRSPNRSQTSPNGQQTQSMRNQSLHRSTTIKSTAVMPPSNSITIGELENRLIHITSSEPQKEQEILSHFTSKKGIIFKSIGIPIAYLDRYSFDKDILKTSETSAQYKAFHLALHALQYCYSYLKYSWHLASPNSDKISSHSLVSKLKPSIAQQATNHYYNNRRNNDYCEKIIKFAYHPLRRQIIIAFKNGIVFFDLKRNRWLSNVLQSEMQRNISDFAFCPLGMHVAVMCEKGIFLWNLREKLGELIHCPSFRKVKYSPDSKYIAVYNSHGRYVSIYDLYSNKLAYTHQMFYSIVDLQWIASTKSNKYCPLRLLFVTKSAHLFILNMSTFEMETFGSAKSDMVTHTCVSQNGNGIMAITDHRYLYYISLQRFSEPLLLADLYLDFAPKNRKRNSNDFGDVKEEKEEKELYLENGAYIVHDFKWSQCDRRIAVIYKEFGGKIARFVSVWAYDFSTLYKLGFITNPHKGAYPLQVTFRNNFNLGALLAVCWSNAMISQHHLCFSLKNEFVTS